MQKKKGELCINTTFHKMFKLYNLFQPLLELDMGECLMRRRGRNESCCNLGQGEKRYGWKTNYWEEEYELVKQDLLRTYFKNVRVRQALKKYGLED